MKVVLFGIAVVFVFLYAVAIGFRLGEFLVWLRPRRRTWTARVVKRAGKLISGSRDWLQEIVSEDIW